MHKNGSGFCSNLFENWRNYLIQSIFPRVLQELNTPYRVTLINKNVPNVVAQISLAVAAENINIANIVNRGQGDYAYTLLDLDEKDEGSWRL